MGRFDSEFDANDAGSQFDRLASVPFLPGGATISALLSTLANPQSISNFRELFAALRKDTEKRSHEEQLRLLDTCVLTLRRHERAMSSLNIQAENTDIRLNGVEEQIKRLHDGLQEAMSHRLFDDEMRNYIAAIVIRGAFDFPNKSSQETSFFLRIAAQMTTTEMELLRKIYELQKTIDYPRPQSFSAEQWLFSVEQSWVKLTRQSGLFGEKWINRKSATVRLQSYGFLEPIDRSPTGELDLGETPYALLQLGRDFCQYTESF